MEIQRSSSHKTLTLQKHLPEPMTHLWSQGQVLLLQLLEFGLEDLQLAEGESGPCRRGVTERRGAAGVSLALLAGARDHTEEFILLRQLMLYLMNLIERLHVGYWSQLIHVNLNFFMSKRVVPGLRPALAAPPEIRFAPAARGSSAGETDRSEPPIPGRGPSVGRHHNADRQPIKRCY